MAEEIDELRAHVAELQKLVTDLRLRVAEGDGEKKAAVWWATGMAALIAAWLGVTSVWQIPSLVNSTAAGQAQKTAEAAAAQATADARYIEELRKRLAHTPMTVNIKNEGDPSAYLRLFSAPNQPPNITYIDDPG